MQKPQWQQSRLKATLYGCSFMIIFTAIYGVGISSRPLLHPDEIRYAEIPREMLANQEWVVPRLVGLAYFEKPILGYWVHAFSLRLFGHNPFALRLPSLLAVLLTAGLLFLLVRRGANSEYGRLAAIIYATSLLVTIIGRIAVLDSLFTLMTTACIVFGWRAMTQNKATGRLRIALIAGIFAGLAFMTKGFLGFLLPTLVLGSYTLWDHSTRQTLKLVPWMMLGALATPASWCLSIYVRSPEYFTYFFWTEHIQRFVSAPPSQHPEPWWYFLPVLILGSLPWVLFTPSILRHIKTSSTDGLTRLSICWLVAPFIFFSASSGKLATYLLPVMPAVAIITARSLFPTKCNTRLPLTIWAAALAIGASLASFTPGLVQLADEPSKARSLAAILLVATAVALGQLIWASRHSGIMAIAFQMAIISAPMTFLLPRTLLEEKAPLPFLRSTQNQIPRDMTVVAEGPIAAAVALALGRDDIIIFGESGELEFGLLESPFRRLQSLDQGFLTRHSTSGFAVFTSSQSLLPIREADLLMRNPFWVCRIWRSNMSKPPTAQTPTAPQHLKVKGEP